MPEIKNELTKQLDEDFQKSPRHRVAQNAATSAGIDEAALVPSAEQVNNNVFSVDVTSGDVPNQRQSGRCWLFANLNILRDALLSNADSDDKAFELSQTYLFFFDKYEKANYFYHNVLKTADQALDSREVAHILETPQEDGGQWDMIVSLIQKYGIVPQTAMPDTENSKKSDALNKVLNTKLRQDAKILRQMVADGTSEADIEAQIAEFLEVVYRILAIGLGNPPKTFDFTYRDKDKKYHAYRGLTPHEFYDKFVGLDLTEYVPVINAPSDNKPYNEAFTVDLLGNVVGGQPVKYINVEMDELKRLAIAQLKDGESVWYGCDVGQSSTRKSGLMSLEAYDHETLFDFEWEMDKADRLQYHESLLTHAMVLTGVDLDEEGNSLKWKVQNSWGQEIGHKGFFVMTDEWMDEYTYQVVVHKKYLSDEQLKIYNREPVVLPAWDPMGSLAKMY